MAELVDWLTQTLPLAILAASLSGLAMFGLLILAAVLMSPDDGRGEW